jgi:alpha-mannosidase
MSAPLLAFTTTPHSGPLGRNFSLMSVDNPHIRVLALKKAETSDEIIVRLVEQDGESAPNVKIKFAAPISAAREVNAQEQPFGSATPGSAKLTGGVLQTSFRAIPAAHVRIAARPAAGNDPPRKLAARCIALQSRRGVKQRHAIRSRLRR